jgi:hypothetical protein
MQGFPTPEGNEWIELGDDALGLITGGEGAGFDPYGEPGG